MFTVFFFIIRLTHADYSNYTVTYINTNKQYNVQLTGPAERDYGQGANKYIDLVICLYVLNFEFKQIKLYIIMYFLCNKVLIHYFYSLWLRA